MEEDKKTEIREEHAHIIGWGVDANPKNDPTWPIRHRTDAPAKGYTWERPVQQSLNVEVLHSIERPNVTAVFGTSVPPKGLSGQIRRFAFQYGEGSYAHWLSLVVADRVNEVEGIVEDLGSGKVPNILEEKGWKARWKHDRNGLIQQVAGTVILAATVVALVVNKRKSLKNGLRLPL